MPKPIAIFDFDGTLVLGDTFIDFLSYIALRRWFIVPLLFPIILIGMTLQISNRTCSSGLRLILSSLTFGMNARRFIDMAESFSRDWIARHANGRAISSVIQELQQELNAGHRAIIATGSMALWVEPILKVLAQGTPEIIGSTWESGLFWISIRQRCFRDEKLRMIESHLAGKPRQNKAFGNSMHDVWYLEKAKEIFIVRPSRELKNYFQNKNLPYKEMH